MPEATPVYFTDSHGTTLVVQPADEAISVSACVVTTAPSVCRVYTTQGSRYQMAMNFRHPEQVVELCRALLGATGHDDVVVVPRSAAHPLAVCESCEGRGGACCAGTGVEPAETEPGSATLPPSAAPARSVSV